MTSQDVHASSSKRRGAEAGHDLEDWLEAERELSQASAIEGTRNPRGPRLVHSPASTSSAWSLSFAVQSGLVNPPMVPFPDDQASGVQHGKTNGGARNATLDSGAIVACLLTAPVSQARPDAGRSLLSGRGGRLLRRCALRRKSDLIQAGNTGQGVRVADANIRPTSLPTRELNTAAAWSRDSRDPRGCRKPS